MLFPIVGRLNGDQPRHNGTACHMTQHGFTRDRRFAWSAREAATCHLVLEDDAGTRAFYPFALRLELTYAVADNTLTVTYSITNPGKYAACIRRGASGVPVATGGGDRAGLTPPGVCAT